MSLIHYQQATYAVQLRAQLEVAGCDARVATLVSRVIGEMIDHVSDVERDLKRDINETESRASRRACELSALKRDMFDRFIGVMLFVMAAAVICGVLGVLITLFT